MFDNFMKLPMREIVTIENITLNCIAGAIASVKHDTCNVFVGTLFWTCLRHMLETLLLPYDVNM